MIFILGSTANDDASEFACDYAVIELTPSVAQKILGRMDALMMLYSRDRSLHEFHFLDADIRFFQSELGDIGNATLPMDASQFIVVTSQSARPNGTLLATESEHMVVAVNGQEPEVYWRARAKYSPLQMETCVLPQSEVAQLLSGASVANGER